MPKTGQQILSAIVILIGIYMIWAFNGGNFLTPPVLSGIAFIILGIKTCLK